MFGYLFFRAHRYYKTVEDIPIARGIFYVFAFQATLVAVLGVIINIFTDGFLTQRNIGREVIMAWSCVVFFFLGLFDYIAYGREKRVKRLYEKYEHSKLNVIIKPWMLIMLIPATFALMLYLMTFTVDGLRFG